MLEIYTAKSKVPVSEILINDPESMIGILRLQDDATTIKILSEIEEAKIQDSETFIDRFNRPLFVDCLSTTSKILLLGHYTDYIVFSNEIGNNGIEVMATMTDGKFCITNFDMRLPTFEVPVKINGVEYYNSRDIDDAFYEE